MSRGVLEQYFEKQQNSEWNMQFSMVAENTICPFKDFLEKFVIFYRVTYLRYFNELDIAGKLKLGYFD